jgi:E3 ubiquitin-protein ligase SHPRH
MCLNEAYLGFFLVCGHILCRTCFYDVCHGPLLSQRCPSCFRDINPDDVYHIECKAPKEDPAQLQASTLPPKARVSLPTDVFTPLDVNTRSEIDAIRLSQSETLGWSDKTSRVSAITRHVLWLRASDPAARIVLVTQYKAVLDTLRLLFYKSSISCHIFDGRS